MIMKMMSIKSLINWERKKNTAPSAIITRIWKDFVLWTISIAARINGAKFVGPKEKYFYFFEKKKKKKELSLKLPESVNIGVTSR